MHQRDLLHVLKELTLLYTQGELTEGEFHTTKEMLLANLHGSPSELPAASLRSMPVVMDPTIPEQNNPAMKAYLATDTGTVLCQRYHIQSLLGQGSTGQVFLCYDSFRDDRYALKLIHPHLVHVDEVRERFIRELKSNERLAHPGIVRTFNIEQEPEKGLLFYTMELVEGETLESLFQRSEGRLELPRIALSWSRAFLQELCLLLGYIHKRGLVYRDLKPSNIMLTPDGYVKLMDFSIAELMEKTAVGPLAAFTGLGYYMAPEQQRGKGEVRASADVFSLGVITYQLLTGELPIGRVEPPSQLWPMLTEEADDVILKAMEARPSRRYASPEAFWQALAPIFDQLLEKTPVPSGVMRPVLTPYPKSIIPTSDTSLDEIISYDQSSSTHQHDAGAESPEQLDAFWSERPSNDEQTDEHLTSLPQDSPLPYEEAETSPELPSAAAVVVAADTSDGLDAVDDGLPLDHTQSVEAPALIEPLEPEDESAESERVSWFSPPASLAPPTQPLPLLSRTTQKATPSELTPFLSTKAKKKRLTTPTPASLVVPKPSRSSYTLTPSPSTAPKIDALSVLPPPPPSGTHKVLFSRERRPLLRLIQIPEGPFLMGSKGVIPFAYRSERPQRSIYLDTYWIAQTPLTNRAWQIFVQESGYRSPYSDYLLHWKDGKPPADKLDHPVVFVGMDDLQVFCKFYDVNLPTEAQWEKAARGTEAQLWPWGDRKPHPKLCNFLSSKINATTPVDEYPDGMSPYGLLDCSGNVWELCTDNWNLLLLEEMGQHPRNPLYLDPSSHTYALRGGCYNYHGRGLRCAFRFNTNKRDMSIGARIAKW